MSQLTPYSSFTSDSKVRDFPALKMLFHADDYVAGSRTWTCRKSGVIANLAAAATKDASGIYTTVTNSVSSIQGTIPTVSNHIFFVAIGKPSSSTVGTGMTSTLGLAIDNAINTIGQITVAGTGSVATGATSTPQTTVGHGSCFGMYADLVDTTSPAVLRAQANNIDQVIGNSSNTTNDTAQIIFSGGLSAGLIIGSLTANNNGSRTKILALLDFTTTMVIDDVKLAVAEMARTQQLFAGWRNKL